MATWQLGVLLLAAVWALQSVGVWMQLKHFRKALGDIEADYADGFVGTGYVRGALRKGTIALVVVSQDLVVRRIAVMSGWSVFARFKPLHDHDGVSLETLRALLPAMKRADASLAGAIARGLDQIESLRRAKDGSTTATRPSPALPEPRLVLPETRHSLADAQPAAG